MNWRVEHSLILHTVVHKVKQAILRRVLHSVKYERQTNIEVGVVMHHLLNVLKVKLVVREYLRIWLKTYKSTILLLYPTLAIIRLHKALTEDHLTSLTITN